MKGVVGGSNLIRVSPSLDIFVSPYLDNYNNLGQKGKHSSSGKERY